MVADVKKLLKIKVSDIYENKETYLKPSKILSVNWTDNVFSHFIYGNTVEPLLYDPLLSVFSIIQPQTHSPNSI